MAGPTRAFDPEVTEPEKGPASLEDTLAAGEATESSMAGRPRGRADGELPETIGRHRIVGVLGTGGMGVVFAAHDPELDRRLAIKLVHRGLETGPEQTAARARMKREAQAMAKLSHPNVITVYDVGEHEGQLYIAMELVRGESLRDWLKREPRPSVHDILQVFLQAGRGLAAAHRAGLVHRDFKPDNVMVGLTGSDATVEEVRVLDFGLAQPVGEELPTREGKTSDAESIEITRMTRTGALVGTPAYMSPEQIEGQAADARSDQFSFCVALWEALWGERPFKGEDLASLAYSVTTGEIRMPPSDAGVPSAVRRVLLRGLCRRPEDRHPDMDALLAGLSPRRRRRMVLVAVLGSVVAGGAGAAAWAHFDEDLCTGGAGELAGVWDAERRATLEDAFGKTGVSFAGSAWARVDERMESWAARWVAVYKDACEATRVRGERSERVMDVQMRCLYAARSDARALSDLLARADRGVVAKAVSTVMGLPSPERCADLEVLERETPLPDDPAVAAEVERTREVLSEAELLGLTGEHQAALEMVEGLTETVERLGFEPLLAEHAFAMGELQDRLGNYAEAEKALERSYSVALGLAHDELARDIAGALVFVIGVNLGRPDEAERWIDVAQAMLRRTHPEPGEEAAIKINIASVRQEQGRFDEAETVAREALEMLLSAYGEDDPRVGHAHDQIAMALALRGEVRAAQTEFEKALANAEAQGVDHPAVARARANLGVALAQQGDLQGALVHFERAVAVLEGMYGPDYHDLAPLLSNIGGMRYEVGQYEQAMVAHERALEIRLKSLGEEHPDLAGTYNNMGNVRQAMGEHEAAIELFDRALALREKAFGPEHVSLVSTLGNKANALMRLERLEEAAQASRRALSIAEAVHGPDAVAVAYPLTALGQALAMQGKPAEAVPLFERALKLREGQAIDPALIGATRFGLAKALVDSGGDRKRAREQALLARQEYTASQHEETGELDIIDAWLAEHPR